MVTRAYLLVGVLVLSQQPATPPGSPSPGCRAPEYGQFDFWIGDWDVFNASGALAGTNTITRELEGCMVREQWRGVRGVVGTSANVYTPATRAWHQTWIDSTGVFLRLDGRFVDGAMRLEGEGLSPARRSRNRITWTPRSDGTVRQLWESSSDGRSWQVVFDGTYRKKR